MWGSPINMGPEINTQGDEMYPFRHSDGKFYFCSNGHIGMGGLDIFEAELKGDEWQIYNMKCRDVKRFQLYFIMNLLQFFI